MVMNQRKALELLWKGKCTVIIRRGVQNPVNKRTEFIEETVYEDKPCKLSIETITSTNEKNNAASIKQSSKLFIAPEVDIPAGSKIIVTQNGKTTEYEKSGEPGGFTNHQEIQLELFKGWA